MADAPVVGFSGFSGSGKTTLIEKLIKRFKEAGLKTAVIKHDAHDFEMDREGKDTYRYTAAGADQVLISSPNKSARLSGRAYSLAEMLEETDGADIVLVEGYKDAPIARIGITSIRTVYELPDDIKSYKAIVTDDVSRYEEELPVFDLNDADALFDWIMGVMEKKGADGKKNTLTHFDGEGNAWMVNVSDKDITRRTAKAGARVLVNNETLKLIKRGGLKKGDVLTVAQIAGIMGAKRTPELIPMCHPVNMDGAEVKLFINEEAVAIDIEASIKCTGRTGVEMEALTACGVAALTVYDMCKAVQRDIVITDLKLLEKTGGIHGDYAINF